MLEDDYDDPFLKDSYKFYTQELLRDHSMKNQFQQKYWSAKATVKKLKKKEDESMVSADAELDAKLEFFKSIQLTSCDLTKCIEHYQDAIMSLSQEENGLGRFLKDQSNYDKNPAGKIMAVVGKALSQTSQHRLSLRAPLVRLYAELDTFRNRAIVDTLLSVNKMESLRTEYRGMLLWMKDVSHDLNPDAYKQLEKFRKVQAQVKINRDKFEKSKQAVCQKIDLLGASRCNLLSHSLEAYHNNMLSFWEKTSKQMAEIVEQFKGMQHYEWSMLKELNEPSKKLEEQLEKNAHADDRPRETDDQSKDGAKDSLIDEDNDKDEYRLGLEDLLGDNDDDACKALSDSLINCDLFEYSSSKDTLSGDHSNEPIDIESENKDFLNLLMANPSTASTSNSEFNFDEFDPTNQLQQSLQSAADLNKPTVSSGSFMPSQLLDLRIDDLKKINDESDGKGKDKSEWFNLFADLDPLSNPDDIGPPFKQENIGI